MIDSDLETPALGHDDIMALLREARENGFAAQSRVVTPDKEPFQAADIWKSFDHHQGDVAPQEPSSAAQPPLSNPDHDLAQLVQDRIQDSVPDQAQPTEQSQETMGADLHNSDPAPKAPPQPDVETLKEQAYSDGFGEGLEMGKSQGYEDGYQAAIAEFSERQADDLKPMVDLFETLSQQLLATSEAQAQDISSQLQEAVFTLASDRAGSQIDSLPKAMIARIEKMAERVMEAVDTAIIRLNPDDLTAITPHLEGSEIALSGKFVSDAQLARGDITIKAGSIKLDDLLKPRSGKK